MVSADKTANIKSAAAAIRKAKSDGAQIVVLPEIWNGPYSNDSFPTYAETIPEDAAQCDAKTQPSSHMISTLAKECGVVLVGGSISERAPASSNGGKDKLFNTCLVADSTGKFIGKHRKLHLFDIDIPGKMTFKESETLTGGSTFTVCDTPYGTSDAPLKIGVGICYDIRFPEIASICARQYGVGLMCYPGAFNTVTGPLHWELLQRARAVGMFVLARS